VGLEHHLRSLSSDHPMEGSAEPTVRDTLKHSREEASTPALFLGLSVWAARGSADAARVASE
jgi:hypothetical protein